MFQFRSGPALIATAVTCSLASAQSVPQLQMTTAVLHHPSGVAGAATQAVLGQLTDDAVPDAAVLHGIKVHLLYAVDRRNAWSMSDGNYTSIARLPGHALNGQDSVIATGSGGLSVLAWNGNPGVRKLVPTAVPDSAAWGSATDLQVVSGAGWDYEVLAIGASQRELLRMQWNPASGAFTDLPTLVVPTFSTALAALDWDQDGGLEYALANPEGLAVFDNQGDLVHIISEPGNGSILETLRESGELDRLVWMRSPVPLVEKLTVVQAGGSLDPHQWYYGVDIQQLALIDLGEDPRKELWLTCGQSSIGIGLRRGTNKTFLPWPENVAYGVDLNVAHSALIPQPDPAPGPGTGVYGGANTPPVPAVMDLDGDGDDDLFLAGHPGEANRSMVLFGDVYEEERTIGDSGRVRPWMATYSMQVSGAPGGPQGAQLQFTLPAPPTQGPAQGVHWVRYCVWKQAGVSGSMSLVAVLEIDLSQQYPPAPHVWIPDLHLLGPNPRIHFEASYLRKHPSTGVMTAALPAFHEIIEVDPANPSVIVFVDRALLDGVGTSGSTSRPPISPPSGGGTNP